MGNIIVRMSSLKDYSEQVNSSWLVTPIVEFSTKTMGEAISGLSPVCSYLKMIDFYF